MGLFSRRRRHCFLSHLKVLEVEQAQHVVELTGLAAGEQVEGGVVRAARLRGPAELPLPASLAGR